MEQRGAREVTIRTLDGQSTKVELGGQQTVGELKNILRKSFPPTRAFQNFHLFLRGSKLDMEAKISNVFVQDKDFIVLVPFIKKQQPMNHVSISGPIFKPNITAKEHKQKVADCTSGGAGKNALPSGGENYSNGKHTSESPGRHTAVVADAAWNDIMSDLAMLTGSAKLSQAVQCPASTESTRHKDCETHVNNVADDREDTADVSLNSFVPLNKFGSNEHMKNSERKRKRMRAIHYDDLGVTGNPMTNAQSECAKVLDERNCELIRQIIDSMECSKEKSEAKVDDIKQRKAWSFSPSLQRLNKIFMMLNTVYGFLQKQHMEPTWNNVKGALKQLCSFGFEEVNMKDIEQLADLCPKVVVLNGRVGEGDELSFSIDLLASSRRQLHDELYPLNDVMPGGNGLPNKDIINAIAKRQKDYETNLEQVMKHWQGSQTSSKNMFDSVSLEDLILAAKDMLRTTSKSTSEECASPFLPRIQMGHKKQNHCLGTHVLTPFEMIEHLKEGLGSFGQLIHVENINPRKAEFGDPVKTFSEPTKAALRRMGISGLYSHQAKAIHSSLLGKNVVVATSTASGKSLCYNLPVLETLVTNPLSCALYLFPTKALAQDQLRALTEMTRELQLSLNMGVYDGDTLQGHRSWLRDNARLLITNPDMLHLSILPSHKQFQRILSNLRFVIVDEAHAYKGAFGCHTALILRRMRRICHHLYGADPTFIISSATAANPREHAMELANLREVEVVQQDGSPCGLKYFLLWNPPMCLTHPSSMRRKAKAQKGVKMKDSVVDDVNIKRASPIMEASYLFAEMVQHGLRCIAFCNTRKLSELVLNYTREILKETAPHLVNLICVYRAGYTAQDRREIESDLFGGKLRGVAATNALELGVDVGNLDATLHLGFPGSVASLWQQAGRAGRREKASLAIYVAFESPLDQHFMKYPEKLFSRPIEHSQVDAHNLQVIKQHLTCAALEHPLDLQHDEEYFGSGLDGAITELMKEGYLGRHPNRGPQDESWYYIGQEKNPSYAVNIRAIDPEKYTVVNQATNEVIEEIEESKAFFEVYEGAVYMHQGKTYLVKALDLSAKVALCQQSDLKYYTKTRDFTDVYVVGGELAYPRKVSQFKYPATTAQASMCKVTTRWIGFRRIWQGSNQVFDSVDLFLPEYSYESEAVWIRVPHKIRMETEQQNLSFRAGLHAACHALLNIMPLYIMCNPSDLGSECANPHDTRYFPERILLFDRHPGGIGIAVQARPLFAELLQAALELLVTCECSTSTGCPNCVQNLTCSEYNEVINKKAAIIILKGVIQAEEVYREGLQSSVAASATE